MGKLTFVDQNEGLWQEHEDNHKAFISFVDLSVFNPMPSLRFICSMYFNNISRDCLWIGISFNSISCECLWVVKSWPLNVWKCLILPDWLNNSLFGHKILDCQQFYSLFWRFLALLLASILLFKLANHLTRSFRSLVLFWFLKKNFITGYKGVNLSFFVLLMHSF